MLCPKTPNPNPRHPLSALTIFSALRSYVFISRNIVDKGAISPRAFIDRLRDGNEHFRGVVHEFLNYLLDEIVDNSFSNKSRRSCEFQARQLTYDIVVG
jgi:ubiquitin C-terminal hydrolase